LIQGLKSAGDTIPPMSKTPTLVKLKWTVAEAPSGRYRSFEKRSWPTAEYKHTDFIAASIECEDSYRPADVKTGAHRELKVKVAQYSRNEDGRQLWVWRTLKARFATLDEAKAAAEKFLETNLSFRPYMEAEHGE
jgi:hypothetical protein